MKRNQFALALLAALAAAGSSVSLACERCKPTSNHCSAAQCDDRGLLDLVDQVAGRVQRSLQAAPAKAKPRSSSRSSAPSHCDAPTCGCESQAGSKPAFPRDELNESWASPPQPRLMPSLGPHSPSHAPAPAAPRTPRQQPPVPAVPAPLPPSLPSAAPKGGAEPRPLRDESVDPFRDDSARGVRPVPARPVQHQRPASRYVDQYDTQASNEYRVRLSDEGMTTQMGTSSPLGLEMVQSSRRIAATRPAVADAGSRAVVTASSTSQLQPVRSTGAERLPPRSLTESEKSERYENPLRPDRR